MNEQEEMPSVCLPFLKYGIIVNLETLETKFLTIRLDTVSDRSY